MRLICAVDDAVQWNSAFWGEHGLAFLVEAENAHMLFDTGQSGSVLLHNLELLGVDPVTTHTPAISHAHYDHTDRLGNLELLCLGVPVPWPGRPHLLECTTGCHYGLKVP